MQPGSRSISRPSRGQRRLVVGWLLVCSLLPGSGCVSLKDPATLRKVAAWTDFGGTELVTPRKSPRNPLAASLAFGSRNGPRPTARTQQLLRRYDLLKPYEKDRDKAVAQLHESIVAEPTDEKIYSYAEIAYLAGKQAEEKKLESHALDMYGAAVGHAYLYLFDPRFDGERNPFDPQYRRACDLYNTSLEAALRILNKQGKLRPGQTQTVKTGGQEWNVKIVVRGRWHADDFEKFEFASGYELKGLTNSYHTYGLGVPLIAIRKQHADEDPAEKYYPPGLSFPVTAFLRVLPDSPDVALTAGTQPSDDRPMLDGRPKQCVLELLDPLAATEIAVGNRRVPLESDLTTPFAYFLNDPLLRTNFLATFALLDAEAGQQFKGLYMLEPYDPKKIPVVMVHGLWSSPTTWTEMYNDLRSLPEIRSNYQFWFYMYPTGQPFWVSATQMRQDLAQVRATLDPQHRAAALDKMVLVGHSMGGLVSRLQTIYSDDLFWKIVSDKPFAELKATPEMRAALSAALFFEPNPSVRRVVTLGTPHRGSDYANSTTEWISHTLFTLPKMLSQTTEQVIKENPGFFKDTELLTLDTSIDSLSPKSPVFPVLMQARTAPEVKYHNIVGRVVKKSFWHRLDGDGDGVVSIASARLDNAESQIEVEAEHTAIHRHPRSVLEVRRILRQHLVENSENRAATTISAD